MQLGMVHYKVLDFLLGLFRQVGIGSPGVCELGIPDLTVDGLWRDFVGEK